EQSALNGATNFERDGGAIESGKIPACPSLGDCKCRADRRATTVVQRRVLNTSAGWDKAHSQPKLQRQIVRASGKTALAGRQLRLDSARSRLFPPSLTTFLSVRRAAALFSSAKT